MIKPNANFLGVALALFMTEVAALPGNSEHAKIAPALREALTRTRPGESQIVIVHLRERPNLRATAIQAMGHSERRHYAVKALQDLAAGTGHRAIAGRLEQHRRAGRADQIQHFWIFNGLSVKATREVIEELAADPRVESISSDATDIIPATTTPGSPEPNLALINANSVWNAGYLGQGVVLAILDTGVDVSHPLLSATWRGGNNSWFDPYNQHATPVDPAVKSQLDPGHGTQVAGVIVGGNHTETGHAIGVAPGARWIAAKIFPDQGRPTATAIHASFQWLLDPDHNPGTDDAPDVVNNSWSSSTSGVCNLEFQADLQALLAAGIVPVFAAGNYGPSSNSSPSPANYPEALSVGAIDNASLLLTESSQGPRPSGCGGEVFPTLVAPGDDIVTTDLFGLYTDHAEGTSLAAPHVTGALAVLLSAYPNQTVDQQRQALTSPGSALDLGDPGPDNLYGNGRLDMANAFAWLAANAGAPVPPNLAGDLIFKDGFETGDLSAWSNQTGSRLVMSNVAPMAERYSLAANLGVSVAPGYVTDRKPAVETSYHARFVFNPNSALTGNNRAITIFSGLDPANKVLFQVQFRRTPKGLYQTRLVVKKAGGNANGKWWSLNDAAQAIEIAWQSAAKATASLYLDGNLKQTLTKLKTKAFLLESVRLGPSSGLRKTASGQLLFDQFESRRNSLIGP